MSTFTLCTIPDPHLALDELARTLRPGGKLLALEHGLSPDPAVARWQHRLTPIQRRVAGGCHFDRPIDQLITDAGWTITELTHHQLPGPKCPGYLTQLTAQPSG